MKPTMANKAHHWLCIAACVAGLGVSAGLPAMAAALPDVQVKVKPLDPDASPPPPAFWSQPGNAIEAAPLALANRITYSGQDWVSWEGQWYVSRSRSRGPWQWIPQDEVPDFVTRIPARFH